MRTDANPIFIDKKINSPILHLVHANHNECSVHILFRFSKLDWDLIFDVNAVMIDI